MLAASTIAGSVVTTETPKNRLAARTSEARRRVTGMTIRPVGVGDASSMIPFVGGRWNHGDMTTRLNPYINFRGNARQAIEFYHTVFGGEVTIGTFAEFNSVEDPNDADKIMHAQLESPSGLTIMVSDSPARFEFNAGNNVSVSLSGDDEVELSGYFTKLSEDATIEQPLTKAPWGDSFGMLTDKFGTRWLINITAPAA